MHTGLKKDVRSEHFAKAKVFDDLPEKTILKAENTFCMALDGDVDFKPNAVQLLIDRLRRNKKVGVVCGRIHPIGAGRREKILYVREVSYCDNGIKNCPIERKFSSKFIFCGFAKRKFKLYLL